MTRILAVLLLVLGSLTPAKAVTVGEAVVEVSSYLKQLSMNCVTLVRERDYVEACNGDEGFTLRQSIRFSKQSAIACDMAIVYAPQDDKSASYKWDLKCPPEFPLKVAEESMEAYCADYFKEGLRQVFNWMYMMKHRGRPA